MDIGKSFTYVFDDEGWLTKVLVGGLFSFLSIILIGIPFVTGYFVETLKNVARGEQRPLPNWGDNLGGLFSKGLMAMIGIFVWELPVIVLSCILGLVVGAMGGSAGASSSSAAQSAAGLAVALNLCGQCLISIYSLVLGILLPAALIRFATTENISAFWAIRDLFAFIKNNLGNYIIATLVYWVASIVGSFGIILCVVGVFFTVFWSMLVGAHLYGQVERNAIPA